jgi:hypothetical protein
MGNKCMIVKHQNPKTSTNILAERSEKVLERKS